MKGKEADAADIALGRDAIFREGRITRHRMEATLSFI
jgi:hypothetical protein